MPKKFKSPETLDEWLRQADNATSAAAAIEAPGCPPEVIVEILKQYPSFWMKALYNNDLKSSHLLELYDYFLVHEGANTNRIYVLWHANVSREIFEKAMQDPNEKVSHRARVHAAGMVRDEDFLTTLVSDTDIEVRSALAINSHTPQKILRTLSEDLSTPVLVSLLSNPSVLDDFRLELLNSDIKIDWKSARILSIARPEEIPMLRKKFSDKFLHYFLKNPNASDDLIKEILNSHFEDRSNLWRGARWYLERDKVSGEILELLATKENGLLGEIIIRPEITEVLISKTLKLGRVKKESLKAIQNLVENPAVSGSHLLPLVTERSKKIQKALAAKTYEIEVNGQVIVKGYENREDLWNSLDSVEKVAVNKKYTITSAIQAINELEFDRSYYESMIDSMNKGKEHEWISIGKNLSQAKKIFGALSIRAVELGIITPRELYLSGVNKFNLDATILNSLVNKFKATSSGIYFEMIDELMDLERFTESDVNLESYTENQIVRLLRVSDAAFYWQVANFDQCLSAEVLTTLAESRIYKRTGYLKWFQAELNKPGVWCDYIPEGENPEIVIEAHPAALVALHRNTPEEVRIGLQKSRNEKLRGFFMENPQLANEAHLNRGIKDKSEYVRSIVAKSHLATIEILEKLAYDKSSLVRNAVALNPLCSPELRATIALLAEGK